MALCGHLGGVGHRGRCHRPKVHPLRRGCLEYGPNDRRFQQSVGGVQRRNARLAHADCGQGQRDDRARKLAKPERMADRCHGGLWRWHVLILGAGAGPGAVLGTWEAHGFGQAYLRTKEEMDALRNDWQSRTDKIAYGWMVLRRKDAAANDTMMDLMHRAMSSWMATATLGKGSGTIRLGL